MRPYLHLHSLHPLWNTDDIYLKPQKTNSNSLKIYQLMYLNIWGLSWLSSQAYATVLSGLIPLASSSGRLCATFVHMSHVLCVIFSVLITFSNDVFTLQNFNDCRSRDETMHKLREMLGCYRRSETFHRHRCQSASSHSVTTQYQMVGSLVWAADLNHVLSSKRQMTKDFFIKAAENFHGCPSLLKRDSWFIKFRKPGLPFSPLSFFCPIFLALSMCIDLTPGVGDGQGGLACCDSWGCKESDTTERPNWTELIAFKSCTHFI